MRLLYFGLGAVLGTLFGGMVVQAAAARGQHDAFQERLTREYDGPAIEFATEVKRLRQAIDEMELAVCTTDPVPTIWH